MTRSELIQRLHSKYRTLQQVDIEVSVKTILECLSTALAKGHRVEIRGFGAFSTKQRPGRMGRNPRSGTPVIVPSKTVPHFKPGKDLRERVAEQPTTGDQPLLTAQQEAA